MNNKYYIPNITDLNLDYIFELKIKENPETWEISNLNKIAQIDCDSLIDAEYYINNKNLRTKYLEEEDIESLGFINIGASILGSDVEKGDFSKNILVFGRTKDNILIDFLNFNQTIRIYKNNNIEKNYRDTYEEVDLFNGKCPSINELKLILKLIGYE